MMALVLVTTCMVAGGLLMADGWEAKQPVTEIKRNLYGHGQVIRKLRVIIDGAWQEEEVEVAVDEMRYKKEEMETVFAGAIERLRTLILGENDSLDQVRSDLDLIREIPGEPIEVSWELDRYDLMNIYGEIQRERLDEEPEGAVVVLKAYLTYTEDPSMEVSEQMAARLYPPRDTGEEGTIASVERAIEKEEESSREEEVVTLPAEVDGKKVQLFTPANYRGWYVLIMGPVICILLVGVQKQNEKKQQEERERQMMLDYPEIVNKLTLLLGAGGTVKSAWQKIVQDYERHKEQHGMRFAYEEMSASYYEMQSGVTEIESYERFGRRCGLKAYRKLAALLTQNLRKGSRGLTELLGAEALQAFEERKAAAKRKGEEAGTKLLAPMFLMLATVLVIVIIPAFLSIQM